MSRSSLIVLAEQPKSRFELARAEAAEQVTINEASLAVGTAANEANRAKALLIAALSQAGAGRAATVKEACALLIHARDQLSEVIGELS